MSDTELTSCGNQQSDSPNEENGEGVDATDDRVGDDQTSADGETTEGPNAEDDGPPSPAGGDEDGQIINESVTIQSATDQRVVHQYFYYGPVYHGVGGDVIGAKTEVKDSQIAKLAGQEQSAIAPGQYPPVQDRGYQAALQGGGQAAVQGGGQAAVQGGGQAAVGWQEEQGAVGGVPAPMARTPTQPLPAPRRIPSPNRTAVGWQDEGGAVGGMPSSTSPLHSMSPIARALPGTIAPGANEMFYPQDGAVTAGAAMPPSRRRSSERNPSMAASNEKEETIPKSIVDVRSIQVQTDPTPSTSVPTKDEFIQTEIEASPFVKIFIEKAEELAAKNPPEQQLKLEILRIYSEEAEKVSPDLRTKYQDLQLPLQQVWKQIKIKAISAAYEHHLAVAKNSNNIIDQLALASYELVRQHLIKTDDDDVLTRHTPRTGDVINMGKDFLAGGHFIHAVTAFYFCAKLHQLMNKGDKSADGIESCAHQVRLVAKQMAKQESLKRLILEHVIPLMREMIEFIRNIQGSSHDVTIENEAWCLQRIGGCYYYCGENQQYADTNESAISLIEREMENPKTYVVYGYCLNNAGVAYERMGKIELAVEKYRMALEAYEKVNDWSSEEQKNEEINGTKNNLERNLKKLPK